MTAGSRVAAVLLAVVALAGCGAPPAPVPTPVPPPAVPPAGATTAPTRVVTTPPGDTAQLTVPWTSGDTVLRQDGATRPGTHVSPLAIGP